MNNETGLFLFHEIMDHNKSVGDLSDIIIAFCDWMALVALTASTYVSLGF